MIGSIDRVAYVIPETTSSSSPTDRQRPQNNIYIHPGFPELITFDFKLARESWCKQSGERASG